MAAIHSQAKLTSKNQTTIPIAVRKALELGPEDSLTFIVEGNTVRVEKAADPETDQVVAAYLNFLESDMLTNPAGLSVIQRDPQLLEALKNVKPDSSWD